MTQQTLISAAIAVLIAAILILYPAILGDQTMATVLVIGAYISGLFRPQPQVVPDAPPKPPHVG